MKPQLNNIARLLALVCLAALLVGCSSTRRYVTHTVSAKDTIFTAQATQPAPAPAPAPVAPPATPAPDAEGADAEGTDAEGADAAAVATPPPAPPVAPPPAAAPVTPNIDWMYIAYGEVKETNLFITRSYKTTSRVLRCVIEDDNSLTCNEQTAAAQALNPQGLD